MFTTSLGAQQFLSVFEATICLLSASLAGLALLAIWSLVVDAFPKISSAIGSYLAFVLVMLSQSKLDDLLERQAATTLLLWIAPATLLLVTTEILVFNRRASLI